MAHIQDRRKQGRGWVARYAGPDGQEHSKRFERKVDAENWITEQEGRKLRGDWIDPDRAKTPFCVIADRHMATIVNIKPKTRMGYEALLNGHLLPRFGDEPIGRIDVLVVREWIAGLTAARLSASWTRQAYRLLRAIMSTAVEGGYIARSPCVGVKLPRLPHHDMLVISPTDLERLAQEVGDDGLVVLTLGHSGIRWGELVALRKSRCHLLRRRLEVAENAVELRGEIVFGTPKGHERRQVAIPPFLCDLLAEHLARKVQDDDGRVFTRNGGPLRHTPFYKRTFKPAAARAGLPAALRMHDLRHTCASILIREGANVVQVQKQLGHKDATTTLNTYAHMWPDDLDRVADALERAHAQALSDPGRDADGTEVVPIDQRRRSEAQ